MRVTTKYFVWLLTSIVALLSGGCQRTEPLGGESADALVRLILGHTSGIVSRKSEIKVLFARDVIGLDNAASAAALLRVRHATLLALAEYLVVRRESCRVALFGQHKYVQLVSAAGYAPAMYELRSDGLRRTSKGNLPPEVAAAFAAV